MRAGAMVAASAVAVGAALALLRGRAAAETSPSPGYFLAPDGGEQLRRGPTTVRVKADPTRGIDSLATGTQLLPKGSGIPVHKHPGEDEVLYVLEGRGVGILDDVQTLIEKGSTIVIHKGAWHGIQNPDGDMLVLWTVSPPGLERYFREGSPKDGAEPPTREQAIEIARKHGTIFK